MRLNVGDNSQVNSVTNRGYTGHEMDDEVGLINMNARVYDPYLGRFMSADPVLPDAYDMQSFNRYSYVLNNPLKYTDPTGNTPNSATGVVNITIETIGDPESGITPEVTVIENFSFSFNTQVSLGFRGIEFSTNLVFILDISVIIDFTPRDSGGDEPVAGVPSGGSSSSGEGGSSNASGPVSIGIVATQEDVFDSGRLQRENRRRLYGDLGRGILREVTDPFKDLFEGKVLAAACGFAKVCRGFGKIGELGGKAVKRIRENQRRIKCRRCFVAGTLIHTQDGMTAIEEIEVGDLVAARDQNDEDGEIEWKEVVDFFVNEKKPIVEVSFTDDATREFKFGSTHDHPFWVEGKGWVEVQDLDIGDEVVDREGENFKVSEIVETGRFETTYNFTVDGFHTYFVGTEGVWVHNMGDCDIPDASKGTARETSRAKRRAAREAQRQNGTPTSRSGSNHQDRAPGSPRHQTKPGADGALDGIVDGSRDRVAGHGPHIEVGRVKANEPFNKHNQPRLKNGKSKVDF